MNWVSAPVDWYRKEAAGWEQARRTGFPHRTSEQLVDNLPSFLFWCGQGGSQMKCIRIVKQLTFSIIA